MGDFVKARWEKIRTTVFVDDLKEFIQDLEALLQIHRLGRSGEWIEQTGI